MVMVKVGDRYVRSPNKQNADRKAGKFSHLPRDENGKIKKSPGRPVGAKNRIGGEAKKMFAYAFEGIGGLKRLIEEADQHPWEFYKLYSKLIPIQVMGKVDLDVSINGEEARR